ncbi:hypothetical protein BDN70DRAFT_875005 [Pholiota conissans]|uniref:Uncharacterized protein n=1 Tax=Pholiota conissans TaxID=109636 RepID=A0A9P5Z7V9_9AGAR|nr:hypothetical protein BDN70DRAFT_875005 [Pholiota conissans]
MSLRYLTQRTALAATTQNPALTNFNHLRSIPRAWLIRRSKYDPKLKSVRPADRIKWWNIVPGDQIRLRGDKEATIHEVLSINRLSNRVFLKNTTVAPKDASQPPPTKNYHYSRCQLYIGERNAPSKDDPTGPLKMRPIFASRIGTSAPYWDHLRHRFIWKRYAVATLPRLPNWQTGTKIRIPWPRSVKRTYPSVGLYDTPKDIVQQITYKLPSFDPLVVGALPRVPSETEYLDLIYNPEITKHAYDPSAPFEQYLKLDLTNPHSRAKKLERWKIRQSIIHAQLKEFTNYELAHLEGRTERQAKADAAFRWREHVKQQAAERKKARWMHADRLKTWERKNTNKAKKEERQRRRLTELMLGDEQNQVIPAALKAQTRKRTA